jgi:hypothetical protein
MKRLRRVRGALSYANVMATLAIFVALGGSSYAALKVTSKDVRDNSLRSRDIRDNTVTSRDIRNGSLTAADFKNAAGTTQFQVVNQTGRDRTVFLTQVSPKFASAPAPNTTVPQGIEQVFSLNPGVLGNATYVVFAGGERIGLVGVAMTTPDTGPKMVCRATAEATVPGGSASWDGTCTVQGTTATITD